MDSKKINEKIQNLLALASNNPSENEAKAALLKAQELMLKYHIDNPEPEVEDKVITVRYNLNNLRKTEFNLMLSVLVANNFRSKTVHQGQFIHFIGFEEDAKAAAQVYAYILNFANVTSYKYFLSHRSNFEKVKAWQNGFIVGLYQAFNSRAGYELMTVVPVKVIEAYESLNRESTFSNDQEQNLKMTKEFMDGYRRGKESLDKREIEAVG